MADENTALTFNGVDGLDCYEFIQAIRRWALDKGKSRDDAWIADMVSLRFSGAALKWFESLDDDSQRDWKLLRQAIVLKYGEPLEKAVAIGQTSSLDAKKIPIRSWSDPIRYSEVGFPTSEHEWMARGRERRDGMTSSAPWTVGWYLVENGEPIPLDAIPTGHEIGGPVYTIRVWHEGGLALGRNGRQHNGRLIPWYGGGVWPRRAL